MQEEVICISNNRQIDTKWSEKEISKRMSMRVYDVMNTRFLFLYSYKKDIMHYFIIMNKHDDEILSVGYTTKNEKDIIIWDRDT